MLICSVTGQKCGTLGGVMTRIGMLGGFSGTENILFLDLGAGQLGLLRQGLENTGRKVREDRQQGTQGEPGEGALVNTGMWRGWPRI